MSTTGLVENEPHGHGANSADVVSVRGPSAPTARAQLARAAGCPCLGHLLSLLR